LSTESPNFANLSQSPQPKEGWFAMFKRRPPTVKAYWWNGRPNFGDAIAPLLINHFTSYTAEWERVGKADVVSVGSVLEHLPPLYDGFILGSGRLYPDSRIYLYGGTQSVLALRGPLTAKAWGRDVALGDPGLLASELVNPQSRDIDLGLIPHWSDTTLANDMRFYSEKWTTQVIHPGNDPLSVIETIGRCKKIVSSSLHGIILADSFGIPRRFKYTPHFDKEGGKFKFEDYSASIGAKLNVGETTLANSRVVGARKHELYDAYHSLNTLLARQ
jgi:Polysaccharide pyruvyl transferase